MTVIAWDGKTLAADSRVTVHSAIVDDNMQKLYRLHKEIMYGGDKLLAVGWSGDAADVDRVLCYLYSEEFPSDMEVKHGIGALVIGKKYAYILEPGQSFLIRYRRNTKLAEGCGAPFAMSAMKLGLNAVQAVKHAIKLDSACGGKIRSIEL